MMPAIDEAYATLQSLRVIEVASCPEHDSEDLLCTACCAVRYIGPTCDHVPPPAVLRRKWDGTPLCADCLTRGL